MPWILDLRGVDRSMLPQVGGKGANLGELTRVPGVRVPAGFCLSTAAFERGMDAEVEAALRAALLPFADAELAVRSSATAEDLPGASFAGQHESVLGVRGPEAVIAAVEACWASLGAERAQAYRARQGVERARMAVVVQVLLRPQASGVCFTADPVSGDRRITAVEAVRGLGEALVSGRAKPERARLREGRLIEGGGGLLDAAILAELEALGRRIEAHFGAPQDIEWCLVDGALHVVQSRPITTLFPIPAGAPPGGRVFVSVGHQQMMTDPMKPLGLSVFQLMAARPMHAAAGRLFVDPTDDLAAPVRGALVLDALGRSDPLMGHALKTLIERGDLIQGPPPGPPVVPPAPPLPEDPALVRELVAEAEASLATLAQALPGLAGVEALDFILADIAEHKTRIAIPRSMSAVFAAVGAGRWLEEKLEAWLGEKGAVDVLSRSLPDNVTARMGLDLLELADALRPHPEVLAWLESAKDHDFLEELRALDAGAAQAFADWLQRYGTRCPGEIDITRPRWAETPSALTPLLLSQIRAFPAGEAARAFERGLREAETLEAELLQRLRALPEGEEKAAQVQAKIRVLRGFMGYREFPKYAMVRRMALWRAALLREADRLVDAGALKERGDADFLELGELRALVAGAAPDPGLIQARKEDHAAFARMTPPRVITSEGEVLRGAYGHTEPGALVGLAVSAGVVEGRARVLRTLGEAPLEPGDILVTPFTDPGWTPCFMVIAGLVTEVGGLMTHGAVIAREYGLPAVVGVEEACGRIREGQRLRVDGTRGRVEILSD